MSYKFFGKYMAEKKTNLAEGTHYVIFFKNGYGVSILPYGELYDGSIDSRAEEEKFEAAVLSKDGFRIKEDPIIELLEEDIAKFLEEVEKR